MFQERSILGEHAQADILRGDSCESLRYALMILSDFIFLQALRVSITILELFTMLS
jgi:hypothetical protein